MQQHVPLAFAHALVLALALAPAAARATSVLDADLVVSSDEPALLAQKKSKAQLEEEARAAEEAAKLAEAEAAAAAAEEARLKAEQEEQARALAEAEQQRAAEEEAARRAEEAKAAAVEARGLDARVRRLSDELARAIKRLPGDHRDYAFAVVPFVENDEESRSRKLGLVVSDMVLTNLARDHRINLIERGRMNAILEEQAFQASGAVDEKAAAELGKLAGARGLVVGEISDTGESFRIGARVVEMESAGVLGAAEASLPKEELIAFSADAVVLRSKSGAFFRSLVAPGWGQVYNREPVKAGIVGGGVGLLALSTGVLTVTALLTHNAYNNFSPDHLPADVAPTSANVSKAVVGLRDAANVQYTTAAVLAGLTASAWIVGALEAYLSGVDVDTLDSALARN